MLILDINITVIRVLLHLRLIIIDCIKVVSFPTWMWNIASIVPNKRQKMDELPDIPDPYRIWMGQTEEVPKQNGAVLVQLTTPALVNALSGQPGGIVDAKMTTFAQPPLTMDTMILMAASVTLGQLRQVAMGLYRAIQTRVDADFLATTPSRIQAMLCAELTEQEFKSTRKRVYETVIEGRGRNMAGDEGDDAPVAARVVEHDIERGTFHRLQYTLT